MKKNILFFAVLGFVFFGPVGFSLEMDWSGQFWSEYNFIYDYSMDTSSQGAGVDVARYNQGGYYVPGAGTKDASFQTLFLRLKPKVTVNDNIYINSEWWVGNPTFPFLGNGFPYSTDQRQYYSTQSRGFPLSAQRLWAELVTDLGTIQVGRLPLHWGLGLMWNSDEELWSRYFSTGDAVRWVAKFGAFTFIPSAIIYSAGNSIVGACIVQGGLCVPTTGTGGLADYSLILKYENTDEEFDAGVNFVKRTASSSQDPGSGVMAPQQANLQGVAGLNYQVYDIYIRKKWSDLSITGELPIVSGSIGSITYQTAAIATEIDWKANLVWEWMLKAGYAPGQNNSDTQDIGSFNAFYFNPNYHVGMILFNYQLANFASPQTLNNPTLNQKQLGSIYDNPIVNAGYLAFSTKIRPWDKWTIKPALLYATALRSASSSQAYFYNYWSRSIQQNLSQQDQSASLGWEVDLGLTFQWDEYFQFNWDNGLFLPGQFFAFSNTATSNSTSPVFASSFRVGVNF